MGAAGARAVADVAVRGEGRLGPERVHTSVLDGYPGHSRVWYALERGAAAVVTPPYKLDGAEERGGRAGRGRVVRQARELIHGTHQVLALVTVSTAATLSVGVSPTELSFVMCQNGLGPGPRSTDLTPVLERPLAFKLT